MTTGPDDDTKPIGPLPPPNKVGPWYGPCLTPPMPCGKGVFVRSVHHADEKASVYDGLELADQLAELGMRWVMIQAAWDQAGPGFVVNDPTRFPELGTHLRARGITPFVFGWPRPTAVTKFVGATIHAMHQLGAEGIVINPEASWRGGGGGKVAEAELLVEQLRAALGKRLLGFTSYGGGPGYIKSFPWATFRDCDFAIPQWYDQDHNLGPKFPAQAAHRYLGAGYRVLVPALGASNKHTPSCMAWHAQNTPMPVGAVCWWDFYWLTKNKARWNFVRDYQVPPATPGGDVA